MGGAVVSKNDTATVVGPFSTASHRAYKAWAYCLDHSNNYYV